jgi:hypothetical protein
MRPFALALATCLAVPIAARAAPPIGADSPELRRFENCTELEQYLGELALEQMRRNVEAWRQWGHHRGWRGRGLGSLRSEPSEAPSAAAGADRAESSSGPSAYTETNVQVGGVDEADFVKTDGTRLYVLAQGALHIVKSWPPEDLTHAARIPIEGQPNEMFLGEDGRVVVFSQVPFQSRPGSSGGILRGQYPTHRAGVKVTVIDASSPSQPRVAGETYLAGNYQSARRIGSSVRVVLSDQLHGAYGYRYRGWNDDDGSIDAWQKQAVREIRERLSVDDLLPAGDRVRAGVRERLPVSCADVYRPKGAVRPGVLSVVTFDLFDSSRFQRTVLLTQPGQVYASSQALYVASANWWWSWQPGQTERTFVHKLDISNPTRSDYAGSGAVDGHLLNQFSMDEHRGYLRLATTETRGGGSAPNGRGNTTTTINKVRVLASAGDRLRVVGESEDLAPGERIYSARFIGNKGYVVTFRQIDPLFTLDLSNPRAPRKVGELKVPGFSTYIHPMDDDYLLTVGVHVPEGSNRREGMKISVFDVRDLAQPKEAFTQVIAGNAWSESLHNHKAFNYFPQKRLLAVPVFHYGAGQYTSELRVFRIHPRSGIRSKGTLSMSDVRFGPSAHAAPVRRSVMADEFVYAISDAGVRVAEIGALDEPLATVAFQPAPEVSLR